MSQLDSNSRFGPYHIVRHIGGGGMAQIYLAKTRGLAGFEKFLALKLINPEYADEERFVQMLIDEAKLSVGLNHVNIGQVFDLGQIDGTYYIAMEFVDGLDVLELVNGLHALGEKVPIEAVVYIGRQICSGLHYAHNRKGKDGQPLGIVHRDISPQNILCSRAGEVKVVDFGIAKAAGSTARTQAGVIKGKVHYLAPEQALGQQIDSRVDIFSTGIVIWEMLTSQMVYSGENVRELVDRVRRAAISPPSTVRPEVPPALDAIVMKALSRRPEDRYTTCHEFQVELTKFLSSTAPEYSGSQLSALVERVVSRRRAPADNVASYMSRDDLVESVHSEHSVIRHHDCGYESVDEAETDPKGVGRLIVEIDGQETIQPLEGELIIGRAGQLALPDARVSRRHARVFMKGFNYFVEDLGSSNGTYLNERKLEKLQLLEHNDVIRVGSCRMRFIAHGAPEEQRPQHAKVRPRLRLISGEQRFERALDEQPLELSYELQVGPLCLKGLAGKVVRKEDGYWIEPRPGRHSLRIGGRVATEPLKLDPGVSMQLGPFTLEFLE